MLCIFKLRYENRFKLKASTRLKILVKNIIKKIPLLGNLGNEALLVTRDDEVFAMGSNGAGCLGQGDMHSSLHPKQVEALCHKVGV